MKREELFFSFAMERMNIFWRRMRDKPLFHSESGQGWTHNPILRVMQCRNCYRFLDRKTQDILGLPSPFTTLEARARQQHRRDPYVDIELWAWEPKVEVDVVEGMGPRVCHDTLTHSGLDPISAMELTTDFGYGFGWTEDWVYVHPMAKTALEIIYGDCKRGLIQHLVANGLGIEELPGFRMTVVDMNSLLVEFCRYATMLQGKTKDNVRLFTAVGPEWTGGGPLPGFKVPERRAAKPG